MSLVQIKVIYDYYSSKRTTPFFLTEDELLEFDFEAFKKRLLKEVPHLAKVTSLSTSPLRITIDEEGNEVDLSARYFLFQLKETLSKGKNITLQAFTFQSPSVQEVCADQYEGETKRPAKLPTLPEAPPRARRSLDLCREESCETDDEFLEVPARSAPMKSQENNKQETPLERYILKTQDQIAKKQELIGRLQNKEREIVAKLDRVKSDPSDGNICRNCHLRLGHHSSRTCEFGRCTTVFKCGEEKFHSGELNLKELRTQIKKHQSELTKLKSELGTKTMALETMNEKVTDKIESGLFEANRENYLVNGNKNWSLLRKHVYLVEQYSKKHFRGKIPAQKDITAVLEKALNSSDEFGNTSISRPKQKRKREDNPAKSTLERQGITFPPFRPQDCCSETENVHEPSPILYTAPKNEREEAEQLAIVMRESLHQSDEATDYSRGRASPFFANDQYSSVPPPVFGYPSTGIPYFNYGMPRMNSFMPSFRYEEPPRPTGTLAGFTGLPSTSTLTTTTNTNPSITDRISLAESQMEPSTTETANLLLSLSQGNQHTENT